MLYLFYEQSIRFIFLLLPSWMSWDTFYIVFLTNKNLCFGKISSQFFNEEVLSDYTTNLTIFPLTIISNFVKRFLITKKHNSEDNLRNCDPDSQEFLNLNKKNFVIPLKTIKKILLLSKKSW